MPVLIVYGVIFFTLALFFYSAGVWHERITRELKLWHVKFFLIGVITDVLGTWMMFENLGYIKLTGHSIAGFIALFLMVFHLLWAGYVLQKNDQLQLKTFHKFSLFVWVTWMFSYSSGIVIGMQLL